MTSERLQVHAEETWRKFTLERAQLRIQRWKYLLVLGSASTFTLLTQMRSSYRDVHPYWLVEAKYFWVVFFPVSLLTAWGILTYRTDLTRREQSGDYQVIFQIVTRGTNKESVLRSVSSVLHWAPLYLRRYQIWVVTEDDVDKEFFDSLGVRVVYVPRDYVTPRGTKYKARALHYASRLRVQEGLAGRGNWVYLMDEESVVGEDTVLGIISFVEEGRGELGQGVITYPNYWGTNLLTSYQDSLRVGDDLGKLRFQASRGKVFLGHHGSHLLIRADVEGELGWDLGEVRAEDAGFGFLATAKGYRWGFLEGFLYEQSPFTVRDFFKQRRRWMWGKLDLLVAESSHRTLKLIQAADVILWLSSLPSLVLALLSLVFPTPMPGLLPSLLSSISFFTVLYLYWLGHEINSRLARKYSLLSAFLNLALIPITGGMEALAAWYGLLTYWAQRGVGFEVIRK